MSLFDRHHLLADIGWYVGFTAGARLGRQPIDSPLPICINPSADRLMADAELFADQRGALAFLQKQLNDPESELDRVGPGPGTSLSPG